MHINTRKRLNDFAETFPEANNALADWYRLMKQNDFDSIAEVRQIFPSADKVGKLTVFNIGGNKVRLIAAIHYNRKKIYIRAARDAQAVRRRKNGDLSMKNNDLQQEIIDDLKKRKKTSREFLRNLSPEEKIAKLVELQERYYKMLKTREQNGGRVIPEKWRKWHKARYENV